MNEYNKLLQSIVTTTIDYRADDLPAPTPDHVNRWVNQFDVDVQLPILREMDHVLKNTYFSLKNVTRFLKTVIESEKFTGTDPSRFWKSVHFLNIQEGGNSQSDILAIFNKLLINSSPFAQFLPQIMK